MQQTKRVRTSIRESASHCYWRQNPSPILGIHLSMKL